MKKRTAQRSQSERPRHGERHLTLNTGRSLNEDLLVVFLTWALNPTEHKSTPSWMILIEGTGDTYWFACS